MAYDIYSFQLCSDGGVESGVKWRKGAHYKIKSKGDRIFGVELNFSKHYFLKSPNLRGFESTIVL